MSTNESRIDASRETVWDVLSDPKMYPSWVVGAKETRYADGSWPEPGSEFGHTQGIWPLRVRDTTAAVEAEPPRRLLMEARVRPFVVSRVEFVLEPEGIGTRVTMREWTVGGLGGFVSEFLTDPLLKARNVEALRRLRRGCEAREAKLSAAGRST